MSLNSLRDEARNRLKARAVIVDTQGRDIDIGEKFTVRFDISNEFSGGEGEHPGHAHFNNVQLRVDGTSYAEVVGGNQTIDVTNHLGYGHTKSVTVKFKALNKIPQFWFDIPEPYAVVRVIADFDIARFFKVIQDETFRTQIDDG